MSGTTRRGLLGLGAAAALSAPYVVSAQSAEAEPTHSAATAATVGPGDARYPDLVRGNNFRFVGTPDYVRVINSAGQIEDALGQALRAKKRVAVRGGGHCLEGFVADPEVEVVLDLSQYDDVYFDPRRSAVAVEAGATLGTVYDTLYKLWGTTVPGGICPQVGVGGHISGGGYGALSRGLGLIVDHLAAVEVVVVDRHGQPRTVTASSSPSDPNHDLWWAHTGGGGGNFGVVSRYWLRSPGVASHDPRTLLPTPPTSLLISRWQWPWADLDETSYGRIINNFIRWHEANSAADSAGNGLFGTLWLNHVRAGNLILSAQVDETSGHAESLLADLMAAMNEGVSARPTEILHRSMPWGVAWKYLSVPSYGASLGIRSKEKSSYVRSTYTDAQLSTIYKYLTMSDFDGSGAGILLAGYGGRINAVDPAATAIPQRDSVIKVQYSVGWVDPADDAAQLGWVRGLYRDLFAATGGVPVTGDNADGAYINYPDVDLADPAWNTSGVPWHTLYYKANYPRLQRVKAEWDPTDTFHHALSVRPA